MLLSIFNTDFIILFSAAFQLGITPLIPLDGAALAGMDAGEQQVLEAQTGTGTQEMDFTSSLGCFLLLPPPSRRTRGRRSLAVER